MKNLGTLLFFGGFAVALFLDITLGGILVLIGLILYYAGKGAEKRAKDDERRHQETLAAIRAGQVQQAVPEVRQQSRGKTKGLGTFAPPSDKD